MAQSEKRKGKNRRTGVFLILVFLFPPCLQDSLYSREPLPGAGQEILCSPAPPPQKKKKTRTEEEIKIATIFSIIKYTEWPGKRIDSDQEGGLGPFTIGVVGKDPFGRHWKLIEGQVLRGRTVRIVKFGDFNPLAQEKPAEGRNRNKTPLNREGLKKCEVLFISNSEAANLAAILRLVGRHDVLTIGEKSEFLEQGVILRVFMKNLKVAFDVNRDAAERSGLRIKSTALKHAQRVIHLGKGK